MAPRGRGKVCVCMDVWMYVCVCVCVCVSMYLLRSHGMNGRDARYSTKEWMLYIVYGRYGWYVQYGYRPRPFLLIFFFLSFPIHYLFLHTKRDKITLHTLIPPTSHLPPPTYLFYTYTPTLTHTYIHAHTHNIHTPHTYTHIHTIYKTIIVIYYCCLCALSNAASHRTASHRIVQPHLE
ncbi:hypothetical protein LX32DRAFT_115526 [Colletotrichum zoysiae]|uniref:Uncharacterized protein n=1 Tax=Colletotrichum zoysiae TaxID=1216348 RepID=A0AAD9H897_9PEZI|nr:hypothetical protein LX32DRAFT_115526 [Colletotrichum zoysiae]